MRFWARSLICVIAVAAAMSGSAVAADTPIGLDERPDIRVRLQYARPGGEFDPAYWRYTSDWFVYPSLFNWLVRWVPGSGGRELEADLATDWRVSPDGLQYTFELRRGVQFHHDYGEMTAEDVVFSLTRQLEDPSASFHAQLSNVEQVEALDDYTVVIRLQEPDAAFLATTIAYRPGIVVSKAAVEERGGAFSAAPVGTGPFVYVERTETDEIVVVSHDDYFRGPPEVRQLTFAHVGEESVALAALQRNEFQIIQTRGNPEVAQALAADEEITTRQTIMTDSVRHIAFSPQFAPTNDVLVRRAMIHALDRELIDHTFVGLEMPTDVMYYDDPLSPVPTYDYDPERARELLAEAGYSNGFPVTIMFQMRSPENLLAEIVAAQWETVGLQVELEGVDGTAAFDRRFALDYDVTVTSVGRPADPDLLFSDLFLSTSVPPGGSNYFGYSAIDDILLEARRTGDPQRRAELYHQAHIEIMTDLPIIPLSLQTFIGAWRAPVESVEHGTNNNFWSETIRIGN